MPTVAIVILNWNGRKFLEQFLPSVISYSAGCQIIVADNASSDDSVAFLKRQFPEVSIIELGQNWGFCEGYNRALAQVTADYFVLLNSDVAVTPGWLTPIIQLLESDPGIAACQPKIKSWHQRHLFEYAGAGGGYLDYLGYPFCRGRLFDTLEEDHSQYNDIKPVFWATGACLFVRATAYRRAGGLEPAFFAHMEEIDLCWRLQRLGYLIMYCGQSEVYHVGGGTLPKSNPRKTYLNFRNGLAMLYKNTEARLLTKIMALRLFLDWIAALQFLLKGSFPDAKAVLQAHIHVWQNRHYWRALRQQPPDMASLAGFYPKSIVWEYFMKKKRTFGELEIPDGAALPANAFPDIEPESQHQVHN